jgi:hypothetical protein
MKHKNRFLTADWIGTSGWVLYDGDCALCVRWAQFWSPVLRRRGFAVERLQADWTPAPMSICMSRGGSGGRAPSGSPPIGSAFRDLAEPLMWRPINNWALIVVRSGAGHRSSVACPTPGETNADDGKRSSTPRSVQLFPGHCTNGSSRTGGAV